MSKYYKRKIFLLQNEILNLKETIDQLRYEITKDYSTITKLTKSNEIVQKKLIPLLDEKEFNKLKTNLLEIHGGILGEYTKD